MDRSAGNRGRTASLREIKAMGHPENRPAIFTSHEWIESCEKRAYTGCDILHCSVRMKNYFLLVALLVGVASCATVQPVRIANLEGYWIGNQLSGDLKGVFFGGHSYSEFITRIEMEFRPDRTFRLGLMTYDGAITKTEGRWRIDESRVLLTGLTMTNGRDWLLVQRTRREIVLESGDFRIHLAAAGKKKDLHILDFPGENGVPSGLSGEPNELPLPTTGTVSPHAGAGAAPAPLAADR